MVHGGFWRLFRGQKSLSSESLEKKYADELAKASPAEKKEIYRRMVGEQERRNKMMNHRPSPKALW
jgi:hypothetical protein